MGGRRVMNERDRLTRVNELSEEEKCCPSLDNGVPGGLRTCRDAPTMEDREKEGSSICDKLITSFSQSTTIPRAWARFAFSSTASAAIAVFESCTGESAIVARFTSNEVSAFSFVSLSLSLSHFCASERLSRAPRR